MGVDVGAWVAAVARGVAGALLPQCCPACGAATDGARVLCDACFAAVPRLSLPLCVRCLARAREPVGCVRHPRFTVFPAWVYDERASHVIRALKYDARPQVARALGPELARAATGIAADLVIEVPLHAARRRSRGYNQASALADAVGHALGVPRWPGALERTRATREQAGLDGDARRDNVRGAFRASRPRALKGRTVMVVDDVVTTGATLEACLAAVAESGARGVGVTLAWAQ